MIVQSSLGYIPQKQGVHVRSRYIQVIMNWRKSCDERGLNQMVRSQYNKEFLNFILDHLIPWHSEGYDYSSMEVNRYVS